MYDWLLIVIFLWLFFRIWCYKAYYTIAQSIRDSLNATYEMYDKMNTKHAYYLSMEFLQVCHIDADANQTKVVLNTNY